MRYSSQRHAVSNRLRYSFRANATHLQSTMTLTNAEAEDTGYYTCERIANFADAFLKKPFKKKYVYFFSSYNFCHLFGSD